MTKLHQRLFKLFFITNLSFMREKEREWVIHRCECDVEKNPNLGEFGNSFEKDKDDEHQISIF